MSSRYITARRVAGNLYDVTVSDGSESSRVPWRGVEQLALHGGYTECRIKRGEYCGEGELAFEIVQLRPEEGGLWPTD